MTALAAEFCFVCGLFLLAMISAALLGVLVAIAWRTFLYFAPPVVRVRRFLA